MKHFVFIALTLLGLAGCVTYPLPDAELEPMEVCGQSSCQPGNLGVVFHFDDNPYSPDLYESITPKDIAYSVLGHTVKTNDIEGSRFTVCALDGVTNPFSKTDVTPKRLGLDGKKIEWSRNTSLDIDVVPTVSATLDELAKQVDVSNYITDLEAKLEAGYRSIDKSESTLSGTYYEYGLSDSVIKTLHTAKYQDCNNYLINKDKSLITAVGFIEYSTTVSSNSYSKFIGELNALFSAKGVNFDVSPVINRVVTKTLESETNNGYQIIVWRKAKPDWVE